MYCTSWRTRLTNDQIDLLVAKRKLNVRQDVQLSRKQILNRLTVFNVEVNVAALLRIVDPGAEEPDGAAFAEVLMNNLENSLRLVLADPHLRSRRLKVYMLPRAPSIPPVYPGKPNIEHKSL